MSLALSHVKSLLNSLRENGWYITAFPFNNFYGHDYAVIFEDLRAIDRGSRYYAVELTFIDINDETRRLVVRANAYGFNHTNEAYDFFGINLNGHGKLNPVWLIYNPLNIACPDVFHGHPDNMQEHILESVNNRDRENGNGRCCYKAKHNPVRNGRQLMRTEFNTAKTRMLRPSLFEYIGRDDPTISFCYREDGEKPDAEIILSLHQF